MNPELQAIIASMLAEGVDDGAVYSLLKSKGHNDDELRSSWPSDPAAGDPYKRVGAVGQGMLKAAEGFVDNPVSALTMAGSNPVAAIMNPSTRAQLERFKNPLEVGLETLKGIPMGLWNTGKQIGKTVSTAFQPNMPEEQRLQSLEGSGEALANLLAMNFGGKKTSKVLKKPNLPEPPMPTQDFGMGQPIDPNIPIGNGPVAMPKPRIGNQPPVQAKPPVAPPEPSVIPPDPNIPMEQMTPKSFMGLSKPGNQGPGVGSPVLPGIIKGTEGEMQMLNRPKLSPSELIDQAFSKSERTDLGTGGQPIPPNQMSGLGHMSPSELVDRLIPKEEQTSRGLFKGTGPTPKTDALRLGREQQILSDPEFMKKWMSNPERGGFPLIISHGSINSILRLLGKIGQKAADPFTSHISNYPSILGAPFVTPIAPSNRE